MWQLHDAARDGDMVRLHPTHLLCPLCISGRPMDNVVLARCLLREHRENTARLVAHTRLHAHPCVLEGSRRVPVSAQRWYMHRKCARTHTNVRTNTHTHKRARARTHTHTHTQIMLRKILERVPGTFTDNRFSKVSSVCLSVCLCLCVCVCVRVRNCRARCD